MNCYHFTIEVQCDDCGRFETVHRGDTAARSIARARAKALGWEINGRERTCLCPNCKSAEPAFTLEK